MRVPFLDVSAAYTELQWQINEAITQVLRNAALILGPEVEKFEQEFAHYIGAKYCVSVGSGLDAIRLALEAAGIGPGDEVLVPANTFIATWLAVSQVGGHPVPIEPNPDTHGMDPALIEAKLTPRTRAIIPVHLYGIPADMDAINDIARRRDLFVLEDAAQAHGARYRGRRAGCLGQAAAWSFYPTKNLGAVGDGGAITTDDAELADRLRSLRNYGSRQKYVHEVLGVNSRLDELQAAVLRVKLRQLDEWNARRTSVAQYYLREMNGAVVRLPFVPSWAEPSWYVFVVRHPERDRLQQHLTAQGIGSLVHYPVTPARQQAYRHLHLEGCTPLADALAGEVLSLPMGPHVTMDQAESVVRAINTFGGK